MFVEKFVSKMLCLFVKSVIVMFTSFFIIVVTRNLFKKDAHRNVLSDRKTIFQVWKSSKWRKVMAKLLVFQEGVFNKQRNIRKSGAMFFVCFT